MNKIKVGVGVRNTVLISILNPGFIIKTSRIMLTRTLKNIKISHIKIYVNFNYYKHNQYLFDVQSSL